MEIVKIDLVPSGVMPSCHASQYDIGREIRFLLMDGGEEYTLAGTETISIELRKPDGTSETIAIPNTSSNYVDWETSDGELDLSGVYLAEISIKNGDDVLGSANFIVKTEADAYDGADVRTVTVGPADICTFETTLPEPLQSVLVNVLATGGYDADTQTAHPINGYSSANITRCGVNLWDEETRNGYYNNSGEFFELASSISNKNPIKVNPNTTYYCHVGASYQFFVFTYDKDGNFISRITTAKNATFTTPANCAYINWCNGYGEGGTYANDVSINSDSTDTTYHAYNGQTYTVNFGQTVYGGVLDVTRGKLHVTHGKTILDENVVITQGAYGLNFKCDLLVGAKASVESALSGTLSDKLSEVKQTDAWGSDYTFSRIQNSPAQIYFNLNSSITTIEDCITFLESNPIEFVYELATPFDIDLTPEVISAIVGVNNVFADCGQSTVKYLKAGA